MGNWCEVLNFCVFGPMALYLWDRRNMALKVEEAQYTESMRVQQEETMKTISGLAAKVNEGSTEGIGKDAKYSLSFT